MSDSGHLGLLSDLVSHNPTRYTTTGARREPACEIDMAM